MSEKMTTPTPMTAERLTALLNSSMVEYVKSRTTEDWVALSEAHPAALVREMGVKILLLERDLAAAQSENAKLKAEISRIMQAAVNGGYCRRNHAKCECENIAESIRIDE